MCLGRPLLRGSAGKKHWVVYALRGNGRVYVGYTHRNSSRHSPRVPGSTAWISDQDGPLEELWSTDDRAEALALELWFWGIHVLLEPDGRECVRGGAYTLKLAAWRKRDARQMEAALAWCRGLKEGSTVEEAVAAVWDLAKSEYDALLHLKDLCFLCGCPGHKAPKCKRPNPPAGGAAEVRRVAHEKSKAAAKAEAERREKTRKAAKKRQEAKARAEAEASAKAAAEKAAEREEARQKKKRETHRNKIARARERKAEKARAKQAAYRAGQEGAPRFRPRVQPAINKRTLARKAKG